MNCLPARVLRQVFSTCMRARGIFIRMIVLGFKLLNETSQLCSVKNYIIIIMRARMTQIQGVFGLARAKSNKPGKELTRAPGKPCCSCQCCIAVLFWLFFVKIIHNSKSIGPFDLILILLGALAHFSQDRLF